MKNKALISGWILILFSAIFAIIFACVADTWHREGSAVGLVVFALGFLICGMILLYGHFEDNWDKE